MNTASVSARPAGAAAPAVPGRPVAIRRRSIAWLVVVTVITLASGWLGAAVNGALELPNSMEGPGTLLWLVTPLLLVIAVRIARRTVSPGRWTPRFREAWPWYLVALAVYPALCLVVVAVSTVTGLGTLEAFQFGSLAGAVGIGLAAGLVKNIAEEAVWRGYFVGELDARRWNDWAIYLVSGGVWGLWHLPYYLFFLPESDMRAVLDVPRPVFATLAVAVMLLWGVLFAELFRLSRSIWPLVLLHAVEDATVNPLVIDGHLRIDPQWTWLLSPILGVLPALLLFGLGLVLRRVRLRREASLAEA